MIIVLVINTTSAFKRAFRIDFTLHPSLNMTATGRLLQVLVRLLLVMSVCCRIGISSNDINLEVVYLLKYCQEELSDNSRCNHRLLVMEMTHEHSRFCKIL